MAKEFTIPLLNSSRWMNNKYVRPTKYDTSPFDLETDPNGYVNKWKRTDKEPGQLISDWIPTLEYVLCVNPAVVIPVAMTATPTQIQGVTATCYQWETDFSIFSVGKYYGYIRYTDDNGDPQEWTTVIKVADEYKDGKHPYTSLLEYKNSENCQDVIWDTGIVFNFRVEARLRKFAPKNQTETYNDQYYEGMVTKDGIPYRQRTLVIGTGPQVQMPDWSFDKIRRIFTLDNVRIEDVYHIAPGGNEPTISRPESGYDEDGIGELLVQEADNPDYRAFKTGPPPDEDYVVIKRAARFENKGASFSFAGIFTTNVCLVRMAVYNNGLDQMIPIKLGTTSGGDEIGSFMIGIPDAGGNVKISETIDIGEFFAAASTLFVTIPTGVDLTGYFDYNKYDAASSVPVVGSTTFHPKVAYPYFDEVNFANDFDLSTGLGISADFIGCALIDGRNIASDWRNKTLKGITDTTVDLTINTFVGADQLTLTKGNLPAVGIAMFVDGDDPTAKPGNKPTTTNHVNVGRSAGGNAEYFMSGGNGTPTLGLTADLGNGDPISVIQESVFVAWFTKL